MGVVITRRRSTAYRGGIVPKTCRQAIVEAFEILQQATGRDDFAVSEVIDCVRARGSTHALATIRTHLASVLLADRTLDKVERGRYRLSRR